ncbi:MAG: winged helix-turn-helix transcriptional regulator [Clostridia bacterium]|nr:winged helix-turn-helix transcriptional regulator [Clostridia bacterium]
MKLLITRAGMTIEREELFREVWGESFVGESRTIDMHIASLREKIKQAGGEDSIWFIICQEKLLQC